MNLEYHFPAPDFHARPAEEPAVLVLAAEPQVAARAGQREIGDAVQIRVDQLMHVPRDHAADAVAFGQDVQRDRWCCRARRRAATTGGARRRTSPVPRMLAQIGFEPRQFARAARRPSGCCPSTVKWAPPESKL